MDDRSVSRVWRGEGDSHPHACDGEGQVFLTYTVHDDEVGAEVERIEVVPCRRCVEAKREAKAQHE